ncbi:ankyrin repeat and zinc finger domain containing 1 [Cricetulus griseus]
MNKGGGDMVANSWPRGQDERLEAGLVEQWTNSVLHVMRGWATGASVCPLRGSVATRLCGVAEIQLPNGRRTALASASVSLLDLTAEAPLVRGLSLVSQAPAEALPGASRTPCPGSESQEEGGSQVELELVELTLGTLDLREFEVLPKRRRRKKKKERSQDQQCGTHVTLLQQSQEDEPFSKPDQVVTTPLDSLVDESKAPGQPELWDMLLYACRAGDIEVLKLQLATGPVDPGVMSLLNAPLGSGGFTLLHAAAAAGRGLVVRLLLEAGADPTVQDSRARPPYTVAADKSTRNEFRRFMEKNLDAYDYNKARVPGPLTQEMEIRQATRKKEQKAARRQREQQQQKQREQEEQEQEEQRRFAALSDREKRALAAERRFAAQLGAPRPPVPDSAAVNAGRCWSCGVSLQGLVPFHYLDFSFCSTRCLRDHRSQAGRPSS